MSNPLVSIVTVCKNSEAYLEECILSVLAQSYPNIEYIIIDGGSRDSSVDIIKKYSSCLAYRVSEPDTGMYNAVNKGIMQCNGSIIAYINSDDRYVKDAVTLAVNVFERDPCVEIVYGDMNVIDKEGVLLYRCKYPTFLWPVFVSMNYSAIGQPSSFWRRNVHDKVGYFDETMKMVGDFDFFAKAGKECLFRHINCVLGEFRLHKLSLTGTSMSISKSEVTEIHKRYAMDIPFLKWFHVLLAIAGDLHFKMINSDVMAKKFQQKLQRNYDWRIDV